MQIEGWLSPLRVSLQDPDARDVVQRGVPIYTVAKLTGHSELCMVERYAHLAPDGVKEPMMLLEGALLKKLGEKSTQANKAKRTN